MDSAEQPKARKNRRKVYYMHARRTNKDVIHPVIRIGGMYLKEFGFNIGDEIEVSCEHGRIIVRKIAPDPCSD